MVFYVSVFVQMCVRAFVRVGCVISLITKAQKKYANSSTCYGRVDNFSMETKLNINSQCA